MLKLFKTPFVFRWIFYQRTWGFSDKNAVYLTFDDGPTAELSPWILDYLKKEEVKATFFCVGENAKNNPGIIEKIKLSGHRLGNHTMRHEKATNYSKKDFIDSINQADSYLHSNLFRPPYGRMPFSFSKAIASRYKIIMWSWLTYDYDETVKIETILKKAKNQIKGVDIIVLHDNIKSEARLKQILPNLIKIIKNKGLEFKVI